MFIESLGREITVADKTRKMAREINEALLEGVTVKDAASGQMEFPAVNGDRAQEKAVMLLCGLTRDELDGLKETEYQSILEEISKKN